MKFVFKVILGGDSMAIYLLTLVVFGNSDTGVSISL